MRAARRFAAALVHDPGEREQVALMVSELATNAVLYAHDQFSVRISVHPRVRVEVRDTSDEPPTLRSAGVDAPGGRGLLIVSQLATEWGVRHLERGKIVWFEL